MPSLRVRRKLRTGNKQKTCYVVYCRGEHSAGKKVRKEPPLDYRGYGCVQDLWVKGHVNLVTIDIRRIDNVDVNCESGANSLGLILDFRRTHLDYGWWLLGEAYFDGLDSCNVQEQNA